MSELTEGREAILGVDTHLDMHVAVLIDRVGRFVATTSIPTTATGYQQLVRWANAFGRLQRAGVEGTGTYGAALARYLQEQHGVEVLEISRPESASRIACDRTRIDTCQLMEGKTRRVRWPLCAIAAAR